MASIGPNASPRSEKVEEDFTNGILKNKTYAVKLTVYYHDFFGEMALIKTSIGEYAQH